MHLSGETNPDNVSAGLPAFAGDRREHIACRSPPVRRILLGPLRSGGEKGIFRRASGNDVARLIDRDCAGAGGSNIDADRHVQVHMSETVETDKPTLSATSVTVATLASLRERSTSSHRNPIAERHRPSVRMLASDDSSQVVTTGDRSPLRDEPPTVHSCGRLKVWVTKEILLA